MDRLIMYLMVKFVDTYSLKFIAVSVAVPVANPHRTIQRFQDFTSHNMSEKMLVTKRDKR